MGVRILLLHGPNLSQLGHRDPAQYGSGSLEDLVAIAGEVTREHEATLEHTQYESEGELVARVQAARADGTDALVINPGALTHYSYALRDALDMLTIPKVELHLSNVHAREDFRHTSVVSPACTGTVGGLGALGVRLAVTAAIELASRDATDG